MRTHSQKITADRLAKALERQGVKLKRHQIVEVLAETFGLVDSNDLSAAVKRGEIDPPQAEPLGTTTVNYPSLGDVPLMLLRDPSRNRIFALDVAAIESKDKADRFAVTPYGGLVALPSTEGAVQAYSTTYSPLVPGTIRTPELSDQDKAIVMDALSLFTQPDGEPPRSPHAPSSPEAEQPVDETYLAGEARDIAAAAWAIRFDRNGPMPSRYVSPRYVRGALVPEGRAIHSSSIGTGMQDGFSDYAHLLSDEPFDTGIGPVHTLTARRVAFVDGLPFLGFTFEKRYTDHLQAKNILRDLCEFRDTRSDPIARAGGILRWNDNGHAHRFELDILLPAELAEHIDSREDWRDVVLALIGSPKIDRCEVVFHPQAWQNDWAVDVDFDHDRRIDVTFEILTMGSEAAREMQDNQGDSDILAWSVRANDGIRKWSGPFWIEVADEIGRFLEERDEKRSDESIEHISSTVIDGVRDRTETAKRNHALVIRTVVDRLANAEDDSAVELQETIDDAIDEIKGKASTIAANQVDDDDADTVIDTVERWIADNVSNAGHETQVAFILANLGTEEAFRILRPAGEADGGTFDVARRIDADNATMASISLEGSPPIGGVAIMPDGETTIVICGCGPEGQDGLWRIVDQYGEEHVIEDDCGVWSVVVGSI